MACAPVANSATWLMFVVEAKKKNKKNKEEKQKNPMQELEKKGPGGF